MAGRRLRLQRYELQNVNYQFLGAFRLRVEATDAENTGADPNVFVYLRGPYSPTIDGHVDTFHTVASPVDMTEYPIGEPSTETEFPFYRSNVLELDFRATSMAEETWLILVEEVGTLLQCLDRLERLVPTLTVDVGAAESAGDSESESDSASDSSGG